MAAGEDAPYAPVLGAEPLNEGLPSSWSSPLVDAALSVKAALVSAKEVLPPKFLRTNVFSQDVGGDLESNSKNLGHLVSLGVDDLASTIKEEFSDFPEVQRSLTIFQFRKQASLKLPEQQQREDTIQDLVDSGLSLDQISAAIYAVIQKTEVPNFLPHIKLDKDGGLDRLESLWDPSRHFWCVVAFSGAIVNICLLLNMHWYIINSLIVVLKGQLAGGKLGPLTILTFVVHGVTGDSATFKGVESMHDWKSSDIGALASLLQDRDQLDRVLWYATVVAVAEAVFVLMSLVQAAHRIGYFVWYHNSSSSRHQYKANLQLMRFFEVTLPNMASLSALKLATFAHPSLLYNNYLDCMQENHILGCVMPRSVFGRLLLNLWFIGNVCMCMTGATAAFAVKALLVLSKLLCPRYNVYMSWIQVACLVNACVCAVTIDYQLQERIFRFIFGGSDSTYQDDEKALANVYKARIVKKIWEVFYKKQGSLVRTLSMLAVMDHYSYQFLLIEDTQREIAGEFLTNTPTSQADFKPSGGHGFGGLVEMGALRARLVPPTGSQ